MENIENFEIESQNEIETIEIIKADRDDWKQKYLYALADLDNIRKRSVQDKLSSYNKGIEETIQSILPILDDFERAFTHNELAEGGKLIYKKFLDTLGNFGLERIVITEDTIFNTDLHEAISMVGNNNNKIVEEVLAGYKLNDKVIRYSKVIVG